MNPSQSIGFESVSKEEILVIFFLWHFVERNPDRDLDKETIKRMRDSAYLINNFFANRSKQETVAAFAAMLFEDSSVPKTVVKKATETIVEQVCGVT